MDDRTLAALCLRAAGQVILARVALHEGIGEGHITAAAALDLAEQVRAQHAEQALADLDEVTGATEEARLRVH